MKQFTQLAWLIIGLLLGGLIAYSTNVLAQTADDEVIYTDSKTENINRNYNTNNSTSRNYNYDQSNIKSDTTSKVTTDGSMTTTIKSPPPSAIAPNFSAGNGNDLCTVGYSAAVQTQILGISGGGTFTEENCVRLKQAKTLYDMGMKVAAVSVMCQDQKVFDAMMQAGTPCPYDGKIGNEAKLAWKSHTASEPEKEAVNAEQKRLQALGIIGGLFGSLLFF